MSEQYTDYQRSKDHRRHTPGVPFVDEWQKWVDFPFLEGKRIASRLRFCGQMDMAWTVMLVKKGLLDKEMFKKFYPALKDSQVEEGWGGEEWLKKKLNGDEDAASAINYGRTLQEPMFRMQLREKILDLIDHLHESAEILLKKAKENLDTVMPGHSHWCHAQPTTYAAYLLAVHENIIRGLEQLEVAYRHTNVNTGGCGACSGTGWPVDRHMVTDLLGFDQLNEPAYDCEASMDEVLTTLFAVSNVAVILTRTALDHNVWVMEEIDMFFVPMEWRGVSSFMPQKANSGNVFERVRINADNAIGFMQSAVTTYKGEPLQDILPIYNSGQHKALEGICELQASLGFFNGVIQVIKPNREKMHEYVRNGYSGAPDLAIKLIRGKGFGGRSAHRVCATAVRIARERGIKPYEMTGELLDEAARVTDDPEPKISTDDVQEAMSLENFFTKHSNTGDPCPEETGRLINVREKKLEELKKEQKARRQKITDAYENLLKECEKIMNS